MPTERPVQCGFFWVDNDRCALPKDHEGDHKVFGPRCRRRSPEGAICTEERHHRGPHRVIAMWPNDLSDAYLSPILDKTHAD